VRDDVLVVVGSVNADLMVRVRDHPRPGETVLGAGFTTELGGKGANQALAAARAGCPVALVAAVGVDAYGTEGLAVLREGGVDVAFVRQVEGRTGAALITVDDRGENTIVVDPGANAALDAEAVLDALAGAGPATTVLAQLEVPLEVVTAAAQRIVTAGGRFALNPSPMRELPGDLLAACDPLIVNQGEAEALLGRAIDGIEEALHAALVLAAASRSVVVTLGASGAVCAAAGEARHVTARPVQVVDSTGAGDVLAGTLAARLHADVPLPDALEDAVAAASAAVTWRGAQP